MKNFLLPAELTQRKTPEISQSISNTQYNEDLLDLLNISFGKISVKFICCVN